MVDQRKCWVELSPLNGQLLIQLLPQTSYAAQGGQIVRPGSTSFSRLLLAGYSGIRLQGIIKMAYHVAGWYFLPHDWLAFNLEPARVTSYSLLVKSLCNYCAANQMNQIDLRKHDFRQDTKELALQIARTR